MANTNTAPSGTLDTSEGRRHTAPFRPNRQRIAGVVEANEEAQMSAGKPLDSPIKQPPTLIARRDAHKLLLSLAALSWALPAEAAIDFDAMFEDINTSTPHRASYLMLCLCEAVYGDSGQRSKRWEMLGVTQVAFEKSKDTSAEAVVLKTNKYLFVSFRGTKGWKGMLTDMAAMKTESAFGNFKLHAGFAGHGLALRDFVKKTVTAELGGRKLWLVGHSLGGALAELLAYDLQANHKIQVTGVVNCGAPKLGGDKWKDAYDAVLKGRTWRWINQHDPVPHLPKGKAWSHVGRKNVIRKKGIHFDAGDTPDAGSPGDHPTGEYLHALHKHMPDSKQKGLPKAKDIVV
jgi:hypothetical protein